MKHFFGLPLFSLVFLLFGLTSCGGSAFTLNMPNFNSAYSLIGVWRGNFTSDSIYDPSDNIGGRDVELLISSSDFVRGYAVNGYHGGIGDVLAGLVSVSNNQVNVVGTISRQEGMVFNDTHADTGNMQMLGSVQKGVWQGRWRIAGETGTFRLVHVPTPATVSSASVFTTRVYSKSDDGSVRMLFKVDFSGSFAGIDKNGCVYHGHVTPNTATVSNAHIVRSACSAPIAFDGLANSHRYILTSGDGGFLSFEY